MVCFILRTVVIFLVPNAVNIRRSISRSNADLAQFRLNRLQDVFTQSFTGFDHEFVIDRNICQAFAVNTGYLKA